jgi:3-oxoacyl-[acyl-carrier-protein] synthase II
MTTPLGPDAATTWHAMLRGTSGVRLLDEPWVERLPTRLAAPALLDSANGPVEHKQWRAMDRCEQLAVTATAEAWRDAGLDHYPINRLAVTISTAVGGIMSLVSAYDTLLARGWRRVNPHSAPMLMANGPAAAVGLLVHATDVNATVSACASGTEAIAVAANRIRDGHIEIAVAGGAEAPLHPAAMGPFAAMRVLSTRMDDPAAASRPYDANRDGLIVAEGAGVLILEAEEHALRRGDRVYAELAGVATAFDGYHMVAPEPSGRGMASALRASLADARASAAEVTLVTAGAASTIAGDAAEARALATVFGQVAPAVTALKSLTGHSLGAAGAIECVATVLAIHHATAPATRNFERSELGLPLDIVQGLPRLLSGTEIIAVKSSSGFGGHNIALTFRGQPALP